MAALLNKHNKGRHKVSWEDSYQRKAENGSQEKHLDS